MAQSDVIEFANTTQESRGALVILYNDTLFFKFCFELLTISI